MKGGTISYVKFLFRKSGSKWTKECATETEDEENKHTEFKTGCCQHCRMTWRTDMFSVETNP